MNNTYDTFKTFDFKKKHEKTLNKRTELAGYAINVSKGNKRLNKMHDNISKLINKSVGMKKRASISKFQANNKRENNNKKILKKVFDRIQDTKRIENQKTEVQNLDKLKKHIDESMKVHNKIIKNHQYIINTSKNEQRRRFLKNQISFTEIDQQKIIAQRKILQQNHFLNRSIGQMISSFNKTTRLSVTVLDPKNPNKNSKNAHFQMNNSTSQLLMQCFRTIDTTFDIIQELSKIGYNQKKNKYVLDYCKNYKQWMKEVYLQESKDNKENYTLHVQYSIVDNAEIAKFKLTSYVVKNQKNIGIDLNEIVQDLEGLLEHIEHLLAQKTIIEVSNVGQFIERKLIERKSLAKDEKLKFNKGSTGKDREECLNLTLDLAEIEARFGKMKTITKVSRKKFEQLNESYDKLLSYA